MTISKNDKKLRSYIDAPSKPSRHGTYRVKSFTVRAHERRFPSGTWHRTDMRRDRNLADTALCMVWVAQARALGQTGRVPPILGAAIEAVERWARQQGIQT